MSKILCECGCKADITHYECQDCGVAHHDNRHVKRANSTTDIALCLDCFNWRRSNWHWRDTPTVPEILAGVEKNNRA